MRDITKILAFIILFVILIMFTGEVSAANNTLNPQNSVQEDINTIGIVMATNDSNCGPAALATVLNNMKINTTQDELATLAGTSENGSTMYGLQKAAQTKSLIAEGLKLKVNDLKIDNIVYLTIDGEGHFSVFKSKDNMAVYLADSGLGNINITIANFTVAYVQNASNDWGYALVVTNNSTNQQLSMNTTLNETEMHNIKGTSSGGGGGGAFPKKKSIIGMFGNTTQSWLQEAVYADQMDKYLHKNKISHRHFRWDRLIGYGSIGVTAYLTRGKSLLNTLGAALSSSIGLYALDPYRGQGWWVYHRF